MAVGAAPQIVDSLEATHPGVPLQIQIVAKAQRRGELVLECSLSDLTHVLDANDIKGEAMIFVRWPNKVKTSAYRRSKAMVV